jgi:hypothetical protein
LFFDEAETLSGESQSVLSAMLNMGYRKGAEIMRKHGNEVHSYKVYCPKVFILIGDVRDTLKDRSIILRMKRGEPKMRFVYGNAKQDGQEIRTRIESLVGNCSKGRLGTMTAAIEEAFQSHAGLEFLTDRDEEIWISLFVICQAFCPERIHELSKTAVDMSTLKTQDTRKYTVLLGKGAEDKAMDDEYAVRLVRDLHTIIGKDNGISSTDAIEKLKAIETAPWRAYRGDGITALSMAEMLSRFGLSPKTIRIGKGKKHDNRNVFKGYRADDVAKIAKSL